MKLPFRQLAVVKIALLAVLTFDSSVARSQLLSPKRGFADTGASFNYLQAVNAGWYYRWGPTKANIGNLDAEFVPMFWNGGQANTANINTIINYGDVEWVLGFNEPERADQANMSVSQAISAWQTLSTGFAGTGIKLISPGVADTGGPDGGQAWLADFMSQANSQNLQVDAVAFHWYGVSTPNDPIGAANSFISRVDSYHNSYNLPVWITEFAIHDWGGNYTDEEVRAANAIFLDNVIPRLESRSHVAGYSWYNWFGDSALVEGNPLTPTNVGVPYVGALQSGEVENLAGRNLGEHVAYLAGGELTVTGSPGTVRYINALPGNSTLSGDVDLSLGNSSWVRIQPGATLRKTGSNRVTLAGPVTNQGVFEVREGTLQLQAPVVGDGALEVRGGILDVSATRFVVRNGQTLTNHADGAVNGVTLVSGGGVVQGSGNFIGAINTATGAVVRVGGNGLSSPSESALIDDFQTYAPGKLNAGATGGVWTGVFDGTSNAQVVSSGGNRSLEYYGTGSSWRGASTSLRSSFSSDDYSLADGENATYFFRVQRQGSETIDGIFGLTDLESLGTSQPWNELAVTMSLFQGTGAGDTTALRALDFGGGGDLVVRNNIAADEWVNVWLVVDNQTKTYQVATSFGDEDGDLFPNVFSFGRRTATGEALDTFAGAEFRSGSNPSNASVRIDDLYLLDGFDLTNPLIESELVGEIMNVQGDVNLVSGARLEFDIHDTSILDHLEISGALVAGGTFYVSLAAEAPLPQLGDSYDLLDFAAASGAFDSFDLPGLQSGLAWKVSDLLTSGQLTVVADVDFDNDGDVDGQDYLLIQQTSPELLNDWKNLVGAQLAVPANAATAVVPEPISSVLTVLCLSCLLMNSGRKWNR